jgi:hypothetical protein
VRVQGGELCSVLSKGSGMGITARDIQSAIDRLKTDDPIAKDIIADAYKQAVVKEIKQQFPIGTWFKLPPKYKNEDGGYLLLIDHKRIDIRLTITSSINLYHATLILELRCFWPGGKVVHYPEYYVFEPEHIERIDNPFDTELAVLKGISDIGGKKGKRSFSI